MVPSFLVTINFQFSINSQFSILASLTLLWLGIVSKLPLLSLCATFNLFFAHRYKFVYYLFDTGACFFFYDGDVT